MQVRTRIKRHPVSAFIILTMVWSWGFWSFLLLLIEPGGLLHHPPPISFVFVILGGLGPSLSGVLMTWLTTGRNGLREIGARLTDRRAGRWWWALLIIPTATMFTPALRRMCGYPVDLHGMLALVAPGLALGLSAGLMEEFGWRGFLLPQLLRKSSPLESAIWVGLIWGGLWHGYADYFGLGDRGLAFWPIMLLLGPGLLTAWSLVLTLVYQHTRGSLLLSILMHATISSSALIFGQQYATVQDEIVWSAISVGIALLAAGLFWLCFSPRPSASSLLPDSSHP